MKYLLVILLAVVAFLTISQPSTCEGDIRLKGDIAVCQIQQGYLVSTRDGQERLVQNWHLGGVFFDRVSFYRYLPVRHFNLDDLRRWPIGLSTPITLR